MDAQLKRGMLEACVLASLLRQDSYGYQIIKDVSRAVTLSESTLYPLLKRLESGGCLTVYSVEHNSRLRTYYRITPTGRERLAAFRQEWQEVTKIYRYIEEEMEESRDDEG